MCSGCCTLGGWYFSACIIAFLSAIFLCVSECVWMSVYMCERLYIYMCVHVCVCEWANERASAYVYACVLIFIWSKSRYDISITYTSLNFDSTYCTYTVSTHTVSTCASPYTCKIHLIFTSAKFRILHIVTHILNSSGHFKFNRRFHLIG